MLSTIPSSDLQYYKAPVKYKILNQPQYQGYANHSDKRNIQFKQDTFSFKKVDLNRIIDHPVGKEVKIAHALRYLRRKDELQPLLEGGTDQVDLKMRVRLGDNG